LAKNMKNFKVVLNRDYILKVKAQNERQAKNFAERFISQSVDMSNESEGKKRKFQVIDMEVVTNDAFGATAWEEN